MQVINDAIGKDITSSEVIRNLNRAQIMSIIRESAPLSFSKLVDLTPLSRATVTSIVNEMEALSLLKKDGQANSTGGRRSALLYYHPEAFMAVGVTMFSNTIQALLTDLDGKPMVNTEYFWNGPSSISLVKMIAKVVNEMIEGYDKRRICGVGVGLPGIVDVDRGYVIEHISHGYSLGEPIDAKSILEDELGLPVVIANRSRSTVLGEGQFGVGQGVNNLIYLFLGQGIVAGLVINGDIFFGPSFSAGEIGHNTVNPDGPLCGCGNRGCLETYATEGAIIARSNEAAKLNPQSRLNSLLDGNLQLMTFDKVLKAAEEGDETALDIFTKIGTYIGLALSSAINLLNPELLVLGGPIGTKSGNLLLEPTIKEIRRRTLSLALNKLSIVAGSEEATKIATIGAATLVLNNFPIEKIFSVLATEN